MVQRPEPDMSERLHLMGGILALCHESAIHSSYRVGELLEQILPALLLGQYRYYDTSEGTPIAFVCWAFADQDGLRKLRTGEALSDLAEWTQGDNLIFVEFLAPYGKLDQIRADLSENVFADGTVGIAYRPRYDAQGALSKVRRTVYRFNRQAARKTVVPEGVSA